MNENSDWKVTGKTVLGDIVTLAKDTGSFIYELTMHLAALVRSAVKNNADKKEKENANKSNKALKAQTDAK